MTTQASLIHDFLFDTLGQEEYSSHLNEINEIIQFGYRGKLLFLNEPNTELGMNNQACSSPEQAVDILIKAKEILPDAEYIGPNGIQQEEEWYLDEFFRIWFEERGRTDMPFSAVGFHIYNNKKIDVSILIESLRNVLEKYSQYWVDSSGKRIALPIIITETGVFPSSDYCQAEVAFFRMKKLLDENNSVHPYDPLIGIGPFTHFASEDDIWTSGMAMTVPNENGSGVIVTPYGEGVKAAIDGDNYPNPSWCEWSTFN